MLNPRQARAATIAAAGATPARLAAAALVLALALATFARPSAAATECTPSGGIECAPTAKEAPARESAKAGAEAVPGKVETRATPKAQRAVKNNEIVWFFQNNYGRKIEYKLYSMRRQWTWPGGNRVFVLPANRTTYKTKIQCKRGEKVCYGAWQQNNRRIFWGVGYNARYNCRDCCFTCNGVKTPTYVFRN